MRESGVLENGVIVLSRPRKYPEELLERGVRLVLESGRPIKQIASDLGVSTETLRRRVKRFRDEEVDKSGVLPSAERERLRALEREVFELKRANEILKSASVFFANQLDSPHTK